MNTIYPFFSPAHAVLLSLGAVLGFQATPVFAANLPPKVSIVQPVSGQNFTHPTAIQIIAQAEDADGFVQSVELLSDGGSLGKVTLDPTVETFANPLQWTWTNPPAGAHKLIAEAVDDEGARTQSEPVLFTVDGNPQSDVATLVITKPANGTVYASPALVEIELDAVDPNGDIRHVDFYANGQFIGASDHLTKEAVIPGRTLHHSLEWKVAEAGAYQISATATDTLGAPVKSDPVMIHIGPDLPVVSIEATTPETTEPAPNIRVQPGVFTIHRTGDTLTPLTVSLVYDGSAIPGVDYEALPKAVTIPAGASDATLLVQPLEDSLTEGLETVAAMLVDDMFDHVPDHVVDPNKSAAKVLIHDSNFDGNALLQLTAPKDGSLFYQNDTIQITATAIDPKGYIAHVEFYDFDTQIGVSQIEFFRAPDPGTPIFHEFDWIHPSVGGHVLTVRAVDSQGNSIQSQPVKIQVQSGEALPLVSITTLDAEATELSPLVEVVDPAQFAISRDGDLSQELVVFFSLHGTAEPDKDYHSPGLNVVIPAGESQVTIPIVPIPDDVAEKMETVAIRLEDSRGIRADYLVQPAAKEATAVIFDRTRPESGDLEMALPDDGEIIQPGQSVPLVAAAYRPGENVSHVDFFAGEELIGTSDLVFAQYLHDGVAVHRSEWKNPPPGEYTLSARAKLADGTVLFSSEVAISVLGDKSLTPQLGNIERGASGNMRLQINGTANQTCVVEVSSDLIHWQPLNSVVLQAGTNLLEDNATRAKQRFYRTRVP